MAVFENFSHITVHFSRAVGTPLVYENGQRIGFLRDFFVDYEEVYPMVLALQYRQNKQLFYIAWEDVKSFSFKKIVIKENALIGRSRTFPKVLNRKVITSLLASQFSGTTIDYPPIGKVILDRQIVDTHGKKVVRVNDLEFMRIGKLLRITHAAIGLRSMVRRLGYESIVDFVVGIFTPNSKYLTKETLIDWKYVHAIPDKSIQKNVRLSLSNEDIQTLHPADLADILEDLDNNSRELLFKDLDPEFAAEILSEIDPDMQIHFIKNSSAENAAKIIEHMGTDEAADLLNDLSDKKADAIISNIEDDEIQEEIQELLEYDEDTAGGLMSTEVFQIGPTCSRSELMEYIQKNHEELESIYDIYVVNEDQQLIGSCPLSEMLIQTENVDVGEIMETKDIKYLLPETPWKEVAAFMSKYNLINVPIVSTSMELLGMVSVDDILPWLLDER